MKKQIMKITQLAKENLTGAERTDTLTSEQVETEKRVKAIRHSCDDVNGTLGNTLIGSSLEAEKRLKGLPHNKLAHAMDKSAEQLGTETLLGLIMKDGGECQKEVAYRLAEYELEVERQVNKPIKSLLKTEGQKVDSDRDKLSSNRLSMDTCASELRQAQKSGNTEKIPGLMSHLHRATEDFNKSRVQYSDRMGVFLHNEKQLCELLVQFMRAQSEYHRKCQHVLESKVAEFQRRIESFPPAPLFGFPLKDHLTLTGRKIAQVIEECVKYLMKEGLEVQGLFRLAGSASEIKRLKTMFNNGLVDLEEFNDVHVIADCLKQYLRELPEPLLTYELFSEWSKVVSIQNEGDRVQALTVCTQKLPNENLDNLSFLMNFLHTLSTHNEVTKMSAKNIGLVLGPNLLWSRESKEADGSTASFAETPIMSRIAEDLVTHFHSIFKVETLVDVNDPVAPPRRRRPPPAVPQNPPSPAPRPQSGNGQKLQRANSESERRPPPPKPVKIAPPPPYSKKSTS